MVKMNNPSLFTLILILNYLFLLVNSDAMDNVITSSWVGGGSCTAYCCPGGGGAAGGATGTTLLGYSIIRRFSPTSAKAAGCGCSNGSVRLVPTRSWMVEATSMQVTHKKQRLGHTYTVFRKLHTYFSELHTLPK